MTTRMHRRPAWLLLVALSGGLVISQEIAPLPPPVSEIPTLLPPAGPAARQAAVGVQAPSDPIGTAATLPRSESSTSAGGQFIVYGADLTVRSAFCLLCDDTAAALGRVLKDNARFTLPIIVVLKTPPSNQAAAAGGAPAVSVNISELTHGGFHLQISAQLHSGFRSEDFSRELVRVLLAERILRDHKHLRSTRQGGVLPDWVMTGVTQAVEFRSRARPSVLFAAVFRRGQVYSLDRILTANPAQLDALSRSIYETSACALVLALLDQPDGPVRFSRFLAALATDDKPDRDLLQQHFPTLAVSKNALEKWWSLQMASLATPSAMETMTIAETEKALDEALMLTVPPVKTPSAAAEKAEKPAQPPVEDQKPGGILGWLKRERDSAERPAAQPPASAAPASAAPAEESADRNSATSDATGDAAKPEPKKERGSRFKLPGFLNPFGGGKKVIFGLGKSRDAEPKDKEDTKPEEKPLPTKPAKTDASAPPTPSKTATAPPASLPRKPTSARSIGGRPKDLPKPPPPVPSQKEAPPAKPGATEESNTESGKSDWFNPLQWFRKREDAQDHETPESSAPETQRSQAQPKRPEPRAKADGSRGQPPASSKPNTPSRSVPGTLPLEDFALLAKHPDRAGIYRRCLDRLTALKLRSHPLYRPLIEDYLAVVLQLAQGKQKGAMEKLENLRAQRQKVHDLAAAIESHLDWYEANHTTTLSDAFDDFLKLDEQLRKERSPRGDAISKYLDAVEKEFEP